MENPFARNGTSPVKERLETGGSSPSSMSRFVLFKLFSCYEEGLCFY